MATVCVCVCVSSQVLEGQRVGHKGLGKSTTVNIGGGWAGTKKTFEEGDHTTQQQEQQEQPPDNAASQPAQQPEATMQTQSGKKKRRRAQSGSGEPEQPAPLTQPCEETTTVEARPKPKWLKVARILLKQVRHATSALSVCQAVDKLATHAAL